MRAGTARLAVVGAAWVVAAFGCGGSAEHQHEEVVIEPPSFDTELGVQCLAPGQAQTVRVETDPGDHVRYLTIYADGNSFLDADYYGGRGEGEADADGTFTGGFAVAQEAAAGEALVGVFVDDGSGRSRGSTHVTFTVAGTDGRCEEPKEPTHASS